MNAPKTHKIDMTKINITQSFNLDGSYNMDRERHLSYWETLVIRVGSLNYAGFSIGYTPPTHAARQYTGGPLVPGPWAYAFGNSTCISDDGGTKRELEEAAKQDRIVNAELGDYLEIDGRLFRIDAAPNRNIKLVII